MTKFSKILTVLTAFLAVGFLGFAILLTFGGPNWTADANAMKGYTFAQASPEAPWTVKSRGLVEEAAGQGRILPEAIVAAQKYHLTRQQTEIAELEAGITRVEENIKRANETIAADLKALEQREAELEVERQKVVADAERVAGEVLAKTKETTDTFKTVNLRHEEYVVLKIQLEEIRVQKAAALEEQRRLRDLLYQARGNLERAERRKSFLLSDGASADYSE